MFSNNQENKNMINEYVSDIAAQTGVKLTQIVLLEGCSLGCLAGNLLSFCAGGKTVSEFIFQSDLDSLKSGTGGEFLEIKVRSALNRLKVQLG
jgi:hypothetical protein